MQTISSRQLILIGAMFTLTTTLISVQSQMVWYSKQQIWLSHVLALLVMLLPLWMLSKVLARFPERDLFEVLVIRFPVIGRGIGLLYVLFYFYILFRDLRMAVDFTNVALLPETPLGITAGLVMFSVICLTYGGIEILGRSTEVYGTLLLVMSALISVVLFREFDWTNMMPFWDIDASGVVIGSWLLISYLGEMIGIAFFCSGRMLRFKHCFLGLLIGTGVLMALAVQALLVLGIPVMSRLLYPNYELVRQIRITDFLDRFELPLVGIWLPAMMTKIGYSLFIVCHGLKRLVPNTSGQRFVIPVGLLAYACSFWFFENTIQLFNLNLEWPAVSLIFQLIIPALLFMILKPKKENTAKQGLYNAENRSFHMEERPDWK